MIKASCIKLKRSVYKLYSSEPLVTAKTFSVYFRCNFFRYKTYGDQKTYGQATLIRMY